MKKTTTTTPSSSPSLGKPKSRKPSCRFKEPDVTCNNNNSDSISNPSSASQQRSRSPRLPTTTQIPGFIRGDAFSKKRKQSTSPMQISAIGIKLPEEQSRPPPPLPASSLPAEVDPKHLFSTSSTPPITASSSSTRRRPLKSPRRHKIQLYNARQNRSTARSASPYLCEVVKKSKPKNDAYQEIYVSDKEYRLLRIALNLQPLPEPPRPRQNFRKTLFGYIAVPNLDDLPLDLNINSKSSCGLKRGNYKNTTSNRSASNIPEPPQKTKSNNKIKSMENQNETNSVHKIEVSDLKYPLNTSSSSNSSSSNNSSSTSLIKSSKKTNASSSKRGQKSKKCIKSQKQAKSKSNSKLKLNFSSDFESSTKNGARTGTKSEEEEKRLMERNIEFDDIRDDWEKWAWRHNLLELMETSASPFVLTRPQEEMLEMLVKESHQKNRKQNSINDRDGIQKDVQNIGVNSKPSIPAICDTTSGPESENELGLEQIEKPALTMDCDCSPNQVGNLNLNQSNDNGNDSKYQNHHFENLLGENMKNSIFAASETCMILMHTLFRDAMKDLTIAKNLKGSVPFQNFVESSSGLEALENAAVIFEMAGRRIKSYASQMRKKAGKWTGTETGYPEFSNMDDDDTNGVDGELNEYSSQICDVTLIETKDDVSATTNSGHFGSCWSDDTFHVTLSSTPDSGLLQQQIKCRDREFSLSYIGSSQKVHSLISSSRSPARLVTLSTPPLQLLEMIERSSSYTASRLTASKYHFLLAYDKLTGVIRKCLAGKHGFHLATSTPSASSSSTSIKISRKTSKIAQLKLRGLNTFSGIIVQLTKILMDLFKKLYRVLEMLKHLEIILKLKFPETASTQTKNNNNNNNCEENLNVDQPLNSKPETKEEEASEEKSKRDDEIDKDNEESENTKTNAPVHENENAATQVGNNNNNNNNSDENESLNIKSLLHPFSQMETFDGGENNQSRQKFLGSILQDIDNILEMGKISMEGLHIKSPDVKVGKGLKKTLDVIWKALVQLEKQHDVDFGTLVISMVCNVEMVIARFNEPYVNEKSNNKNSNNNNDCESRSDVASPTTSSQKNSSSSVPAPGIGLEIIPLSRSFSLNIRKLEENILNIYSLCKRMDILASHLATKSLHKLKKTQASEKARMADKVQNRIPWYKKFRHKKPTENMKASSVIVLDTVQEVSEEIKAE